MSENMVGYGASEPNVKAGAPRAAREAVLIFRRVAGGEAGELSVARLLAEAMTAAHEVSAASWAVTVGRGDGSVRLDVGRCAILALGEGKVMLALESMAVPAEAVAEGEWEEPWRERPFRSVPGLRVLSAPVEVVLRAYDRLEPAFLGAVRAAPSLALRRLP